LAQQLALGSGRLNLRVAEQGSVSRVSLVPTVVRQQSWVLVAEPAPRVSLEEQLVQ